MKGGVKGNGVKGESGDFFTSLLSLSLRPCHIRRRFRVKSVRKSKGTSAGEENGINSKP